MHARFCMHVFKACKLNAFFLYRYLNMCQIYVCMHTNRKLPKYTAFPCMHVFMRVRVLVCPSNLPAMFVSSPHVILSLHVQTWLQGGAVVTLRSPAQGRAAGHEPASATLSLHRIEDQGLQLGGQGARVQLTCQPVSQQRRRRAGTMPPMTGHLHAGKSH